MITYHRVEIKGEGAIFGAKWRKKGVKKPPEASDGFCGAVQLPLRRFSMYGSTSSKGMPSAADISP